MASSPSAANPMFSPPSISSSRAPAASPTSPRSFCAYFSDDFTFDPAAVTKFLKDSTTRDLLVELGGRYDSAPEFTEASAEQLLRAFAEEKGVKPGVLINGARVALTGQAVAPSLFAVMLALGRERVVRRLQSAASISAPSRERGGAAACLSASSPDPRSVHPTHAASIASGLPRLKQTGRACDIATGSSASASLRSRSQPSHAPSGWHARIRPSSPGRSFRHSFSPSYGSPTNACCASSANPRGSKASIAVASRDSTINGQDTATPASAFSIPNISTHATSIIFGDRQPV